MSLKSVAKVTCSLSHHRARTELNLVPTFARTRTLANNKIRTRIGTSARNNFMCTFMTRNHALIAHKYTCCPRPFRVIFHIDKMYRKKTTSHDIIRKEENTSTRTRKRSIRVRFTPHAYLLDRFRANATHILCV